MYKHIHVLLITLLVLSVPTEIIAQDTSPPTAPGNVKVDLAGTRFVKLSWDAATDDSGSVTYEVEEDGATPPHSVSDPEWTSPVANLLPETSHDYRVRAVDAAGNASDWQSITVETIAEVDGTGYLLLRGIVGTNAGGSKQAC